MAIKIIDESPDIHLTRSEYNRLRHEYDQAMQYYAGPRIDFEDWVAQRAGKHFLTNGTGQISGL